MRQALYPRVCQIVVVYVRLRRLMQLYDYWTGHSVNSLWYNNHALCTHFELKIVPTSTPLICPNVLPSLYQAKCLHNVLQTSWIRAYRDVIWWFLVLVNQLVFDDSSSFESYRGNKNYRMRLINNQRYRSSAQDAYTCHVIKYQMSLKGECPRNELIAETRQRLKQCNGHEKKVKADCIKTTCNMRWSFLCTVVTTTNVASTSVALKEPVSLPRVFYVDNIYGSPALLWWRCGRRILLRMTSRLTAGEQVKLQGGFTNRVWHQSLHPPIICQTVLDSPSTLCIRMDVSNCSVTILIWFVEVKCCEVKQCQRRNYSSTGPFTLDRSSTFSVISSGPRGK